MNGDLPIRLGNLPDHPHTSAICQNSYSGNCYVIYTQSHKDTVPEICHRYMPQAYKAVPCPDCPMVRSLEIVYTEVMRKKKACV
jgi:hypothetical protein